MSGQILLFLQTRFFARYPADGAPNNSPPHPVPSWGPDVLAPVQLDKPAPFYLQGSAITCYGRLVMCSQIPLFFTSGIFTCDPVDGAPDNLPPRPVRAPGPGYLGSH